MIGGPQPPAASLNQSTFRRPGRTQIASRQDDHHCATDWRIGSPGGTSRIIRSRRKLLIERDRGHRLRGARSPEKYQLRDSCSFRGPGGNGASGSPDRRVIRRSRHRATDVGRARRPPRCAEARTDFKGRKRPHVGRWSVGGAPRGGPRPNGGLPWKQTAASRLPAVAGPDESRLAQRRSDCLRGTRNPYDRCVRRATARSGHSAR